MTGRRLLSIGTTALLILVAAGCGGAGGSKAGPAPAPSATTQHTAGTSASTGTIRIGVLLPLTGPLAGAGTDVQTGTKLYWSSIHHQVAGKRIQIYYTDDQGSSATAVTKAKQLVEADHVNLLAGVVSTSVCYGVAPYVKQAKVPFVVTGDCGAVMAQLTPSIASPYLVRTTQLSNEFADPAADYVAKHGFKKVVTMAADYAGGTEVIGAFDWTYIHDGGRVLQEFWPPLSTTDFSSYVSQINRSADAIVGFFPGAGGLRFVEQVKSYGLKMPIIDLSSELTGGSPTALTQLKDAAVGVIPVMNYSTAAPGAQNQAYLSAFHKAFPHETPTPNITNGYAGAEFIAAALNKVHGNVSDIQALLKALYTTKVDTPRGPLHLDQTRDPVENMYVYKIVKSGSGYGQQLLHTYTGVSKTWAHSVSQIEKFPWKQVKGRFVNISKAQLQSMLSK